MFGTCLNYANVVQHEKSARRYWEEKKACWDAKIDKICPKKACIRMGYCGKAEASSVCANMGPFKQVCEQALSTVGQLFQENHEQPLAVLTNHVSCSTRRQKRKAGTVLYWERFYSNVSVLVCSQQAVKRLELR